MLKTRGMIIRFILVLLLLLTMAILVNGQDEGVIPEEIKTEASEPQGEVEPVEKITRLDVTIIDGVNDKLIKLENCMVYVVGELHVVNDSFTYQKTFVEGDRYDITIHFRPKK